LSEYYGQVKESSAQYI